ncbi:RluA family pseudouridine synthase [Paenibacillus sp. NPDC058174]|uniref:RluA family pseudouridine synthase n=1 Tax=Paenibacillus sp. NPDC058174 TaxID=3346366 RepID=UPI0036DE6DD1
MKPTLAYRRDKEWLVLDGEGLSALAAAANAESPEAGISSHAMRQWLIDYAPFPAKWINRLFSVGGIQREDEALKLLAFPAAAKGAADPLYRKAAASRSGAQETVFAELLYEDDFCAVFLKPAGMPVHESHPGQSGTLDEAAAQHMLAKNDLLPVRHIHRLDDDTSGPVLYSKNDLAQWVLDEAMRAKRIDRRYIAVVHGRLAARSGTIHAPIGKDRHQPSRRRVSPNGEQAVTHYELVETIGNASVVRLQLETGRTHQIRVHMSHIGHPLVGDRLYGGDGTLLPHQALHGERLLFPHPWTGLSIEAKAPAPAWLETLRDKLGSRTK